MIKYKIALFPGDGVGPELINEGLKVIGKAAELDNFEIEWIKYPHGADHYSETKELLNEKVLKEIDDSCNAIYCGTFDNLKLNNSLLSRGIASGIRNYFGQSIILRPVKLLPSVESPLRLNMGINITIIRENSEDFYIDVGGNAKSGRRYSHEINKNGSKARFSLSMGDKSDDLAYQLGILSRKACENVIQYAFEYAKNKKYTKITSIDKANMLNYYSFWRENMENISKDYDTVHHEFHLIDQAVMNLLKHPEKYEIILAPNMFGDILADLGTVLQGGLAFGARANINPKGISMFEPIHGSAAKLKGKGFVNPIATIWAGSLMLDALGQSKSSESIMNAIEYVLREKKIRTIDLEGNNTTSEMGGAIVDKFVQLHE